MRVHLINPQPRGLQPAVSNNELYRRPRGSLDPVGFRVAVALTVSAAWDDPHLAHLEDVQYRAVAYGVNDTQVSSDWFDRLVIDPDAPWDPEDFIDDEFEFGEGGQQAGVYGQQYPVSY